jgi:hypothetical protein
MWKAGAAGGPEQLSKQGQSEKGLRLKGSFLKPLVKI